jgi:hypothetical protein
VAISPELVLVDPAIREQAIALLPDYGWQQFLAQARVAPKRPVPATTEPLSRALRATAPWMVVAFTGITSLTFALTLIANSIR